MFGVFMDRYKSIKTISGILLTDDLCCALLKDIFSVLKHWTYFQWILCWLKMTFLKDQYEEFVKVFFSLKSDSS